MLHRKTLGALALALGSLNASADVLFSDNFNADSSANWTVNRSTGSTNTNDAGSHANFFFDYSTVGIPAAPNSNGNRTGLRLDANTTGGVFSGLSVSPTGKSFAGDYRLRFDMWLNFLGPAPVGGSGTTQVAGAGIGTAGTTAQWAGAGTQESIHFGATLDGQSTVDYRAYSSAAPTGYVAASGVFAAGTGTSPDARADTHPYYAGLGGKTPPADQTTLVPSQTGTTSTGSLGFAWRDVIIEKNGNAVTWTVDGKLIATVDASTVNLGGGNILLNHYDTNAGSATDPNAMNFSLFDNLRVESLAPVPEPAGLGLIGLGVLSLARRRNRR
jgi:hypothetical protein